MAAFFQKLFSRHKVHSVLDCACGTGRHLPLFHSLGCEVVGSDISPSMLAQARWNLGNLALEISLHQVDYRRLPEQFDRRFDAVACLSSSILHMQNPEEALRALGSMHQVLREGGLLILTQGTTDKQWREKPRFILATSTSEFTRLFVIDYEGEGARYNVLDIWHSEEADELKVWSVDYAHVYLRDDQERLLRASGFRSISFYGGYRFEPYSPETSDHLISVGLK
jgi:SAM-dependent methyltransferase